MNQPQNVTRRRVAVAWMLGISTLATAQVAGAQPRWGRPETPRAGACFYRDFNFRGDYFCARPGETIAFLPRGMNDQISSIRAFGDTEVTIFQDPRFQGRWTRLEDDVRNLRSEGWNDRLSSVRVSRGWGRSRGQYGGGRSGSGIGRIESREWRDDRDDRGERREGSGIDNNDRSGSGRNQPVEPGRGVGRNEGRNQPVDPRGGVDSGRRSGGNADAIVRRLYQEILQREPDAPGLTLYRDRMNNEGWTEQDVRDALLKSPEYRQRSTQLSQQNAEQIVARAYRSTLNREPDPASKVYVDKVMRERWTEADVVKALKDSPEYRNKVR